MSAIAFRFLLSLFTALVIALGSAPAGAQSFQEKKEARGLAKKAEQAEKKKDFEAAKDAYERAIDLHASTKYLLGLARAEAGLGRTLAALEVLETIVQDDKAPKTHRARAKKAISKLEQSLVQLTVAVPEDFAGTVTVDGNVVESSALASPVRLEAGKHSVVAQAPGFEKFEEELELAEGEARTVTVALTPVGDDAPAGAAPVDDRGATTKNDEEPEPVPDDDGGGGSATTTLGIISLGVGAVGVGVGVVFGLAAQSTRKDLDDACPGDVCAEGQRGTFDDGRRQATFSTIGFVVGGVGIAAGTALLLFGSGGGEASANASVQPVIGLGAVGARGTF